MIRITIGLITALLLAGCVGLGTPAVPPQTSSVTSGVGHPAADYPGPRAY